MHDRPIAPPRVPGPRLLPMLILICLALGPGSPASADLDLTHQTLELPGAPAVVLPADLDGDGRRDLAIFVAYTEWDRISIEERSELDGVDGLVEVMTIVPALFDRRELHVFLQDEEGLFQASGEPLTVGYDVLSMARGPGDLAVVALTDEGLAQLELDADGRPVLTPVLAQPPVLAGTGVFFPQLELMAEITGDSQPDLWIPTDQGLALYPSTGSPGTGSAVPPGPSQVVTLPGDERTGGRQPRRHYPLPEVRDVDGDGLQDLLVPGRRPGWNRFWVLRNEGGGRFAPPLTPLGEPASRAETLAEAFARRHGSGDDDEEEENEAPEDPYEGEVVYFGDLDGDGRAEFVTQKELETPEDAGARQEIAHAKSPPHRYRLYRSGTDLAMAAEPYAEFVAQGYVFGNESSEIRLPAGFQDLDGDGRKDLVSFTLDFSIFKMIAGLALKRISLGMDFHVFCQNQAGRFEEVKGLDLSGKFKLNLNNLQLGHFSLFAGDFDGDGRADFVQAGRGKNITIHLGREGCVYPPKPDHVVRLEDAPRDLSLVQVMDVEGDGRSDLLVTQPGRAPEPGVTPSVRLEIYRSGGAR